MTDLLLDQFVRMLASLDGSDDEAQLDRSGFLDLLRAENAGGAGVALEEFFPLVIAAGALPGAGAVIHTIVARAADPAAPRVEDCCAVLIRTGVARDQARAVAAAVTAGLMAGAMMALLDKTVDYARTRRQFGREIGRFQVIQHQIAVMAEECLAARMSAQMAFAGAAIGDVRPQRAAIAKLRGGQAAIVVGATAHAVHGAIGISDEFGLHRWTAMLQQGRSSHGGESYWARLLGRSILERTETLSEIARSL